MARALVLARETGLYSAHPNPRVGCVLTREGVVVGEAGHRRAGEAHAEVLALESAADRALGADCYVTLEPCVHHGRTPPCDQALIAAGVRRVFVAMVDPDPRVGGKGVERLRQAGVEVSVGLLESAARRLNAGYERRQTRGMPWLRCKLAMSLDGRTALADGDSRWITSAPARADGHRWRAMSSAVVTGIGTVLADDPLLTVRDGEAKGLLYGRAPLRVVLDRDLRLPERPRLFEDDGPVLVFCRKRVLETRQRKWTPPFCRIVPLAVDEADEAAFVKAALGHLAAHEDSNEVLLEAGPTLSGVCFRAGLIDEMILYVAPRFLGPSAMPLLDLPTLDRVSDSPGWVWEGTAFVGDDLRLIGAPRPASR